MTPPTTTGEHDGEIHVTAGSDDVVYVCLIGPRGWAEYLTGPDDAGSDDREDIVPVATPLVDGLPLWAVDELFEVAGADGPVVALVDGQLVGLGRARPKRT